MSHEAFSVTPVLGESIAELAAEPAGQVAGYLLHLLSYETEFGPDRHFERIDSLLDSIDPFSYTLDGCGCLDVHPGAGDPTIVGDVCCGLRPSRARRDGTREPSDREVTFACKTNSPRG